MGLGLLLVVAPLVVLFVAVAVTAVQAARRDGDWGGVFILGVIGTIAVGLLLIGKSGGLR